VAGEGVAIVPAALDQPKQATPTEMRRTSSNLGAWKGLERSAAASSGDAVRPTVPETGHVESALGA